MTNAMCDPPHLPTVQPTLEELQKKPWKYIGYKGFSEWIASDDDFIVIRRFDVLATRVVLFLQWRLTKLEDDLDRLDLARSYKTESNIDNGSFSSDDDERRDKILSIYTNLKDYYEFTNQYKNLKNEPDASAHNKTNLLNWLKTHNGAIDPTESEYIQNQNDLFSIKPTVRTPLRRVLEKFEVFRRNKHFRRDRVENKSKFANPYNLNLDTYHADETINHFVTALICVAGFSALIVPLWILLFIYSKTYQLAVITICLAFFLAIIQSSTAAKPFESLAATAAYAAVLMVFVQMGS